MSRPAHQSRVLSRVIRDRTDSRPRYEWLTPKTFTSSCQPLEGRSSAVALGESNQYSASDSHTVPWDIVHSLLGQLIRRSFFIIGLRVPNSGAAATVARCS